MECVRSHQPLMRSNAFGYSFAVLVPVGASLSVCQHPLDCWPMCVHAGLTSHARLAGTSEAVHEPPPRFWYLMPVGARAVHIGHPTNHDEEGTAQCGGRCRRQAHGAECSAAVPARRKPAGLNIRGTKARDSHVPVIGQLPQQLDAVAFATGRNCDARKRQGDRPDRFGSASFAELSQ